MRTTKLALYVILTLISQMSAAMAQCPTGEWRNPTTAPGMSEWSEVAFGNGRFVAVSSGDGQRAAWSTDGMTWNTPTTTLPNNAWRWVTYGNGMFVAVGYSGTRRVATSTNGDTWNLVNSALTNNGAWQSVTYGNGRFVAVANNGTRVITSQNGTSWTAASNVPAGEWSTVAYGNGMFVALSFGSNPRAMSSPDGLNWTARTMPSGGWMDVIYGGGQFVAVSWTDNHIATSPDGITWTARSVPDSRNWGAITYTGGHYIVVGGGGSGPNRMMVSNDGIEWTPQPIPHENQSLSTVTWGNDTLVVTGHDLYPGTPQFFIGDCAQGCYMPNTKPGARKYFAGEATYKLCTGEDWVPFHVSETLPGSCPQEARLEFDTDESAYKYCTASEWKKISCVEADGGSGGENCEILSGDIEYKSRLRDTTNMELPTVARVSPDGDLVYVVSRLSERLAIYDVSNSPAAPTLAGSTPASSGFYEVNGLEILGSHAFAVARGNNSLNVFDISNPASPSRIAAVRSSPQNQMMNLWGLALTDSGSHAVTVSWGSGGSSNQCFLHVFDISNPASPNIVGTLNVTTATGTAWHYCEKVRVRNNVAFVSMTDGGMLTVDVSNPSNPVFLDRLEHPDAFRASHIGLSEDGNYAFLVTWTNGGNFHSIDIRDPSDLQHVAHITHPALRVSYGLTVRGNYAFVGSDDMPAFTVVNISDPHNPVVGDYISDTTNLNEPGDSAIYENFAYVPAYANHALSVVELGCNVTGEGGSAPTAGLIGHWKLDESSGTTASATVGGLDATLHNGPQWQAAGGVVGGALQFTGGSNQHAITTDTSIFDTDPGDVVSVAFWFKRSAMQGDPWEYILFNEADCTGWTFDIDNGALWFVLSTSNNHCTSPAHYNAIANDVRYDDGEWHHAVGIVDRPAGQMRLYVDGNLKATTSSINSAAGNPGYDFPFRFGADWENNRNYKGMLDDVRIYDRALTLQEIGTLYSYRGAPIGCCQSLGSCSSPAAMNYFSDEKVLAYCDGDEWLPMAGESCGVDPCMGSPGAVCLDGTIYAGLSPDGNVPMFTTRCDAGQSWNGSACAGTRPYLPWNHGGAGPLSDWLLIDVSSQTNGTANSATLFTADASSNAGQQGHLAARHCGNLNEGGHNDWYLPSISELEVLASNRTVIGGFGSDYWSSTEVSRTDAMANDFWGTTFGNRFTVAKNANIFARCVRKGG